MKDAVKSRPTRKLYKVRMTKEGDLKTRYLNYIWARSAREARQIVRDRKRRAGEKVIEIAAGAVG
jgi:predicted nicotinamide N-methyase